jgi:diacylglycerol kinase (ATP)
MVVRSLSKPLGISGWTPLLAMINPKSGGQEGERVFSQLLRLLNPVQVVNLEETSPEEALQMCQLLPDACWRVVVCGGDGTIGWVLGAIDRAKLSNPPAVGVLPLGTGNDLARVLGWGGGYEGEPLTDILTDLEHAQLTKLDRWNVAIQESGRFGMHGSLKNFVMNSYMGVGCDAGVALNFHTQRQNNPGLFISRYFNKAWYVGYGAKDVLEQSCKSLESKIEVWLDDRKLELPALEGIVVLNINSWSAGCCVWSDEGTDGLSQSRYAAVNECTHVMCHSTLQGDI